jgi:hypothetical protein
MLQIFKKFFQFFCNFYDFKNLNSNLSSIGKKKDFNKLKNICSCCANDNTHEKINNLIIFVSYIDFSFFNLLFQILKTDDSGWTSVRNCGKTGLFPENYLTRN